MPQIALMILGNKSACRSGLGPALHCRRYTVDISVKLVSITDAAHQGICHWSLSDGVGSKFNLVENGERNRLPSNILAFNIFIAFVYQLCKEDVIKNKKQNKKKRFWKIQQLAWGHKIKTWQSYEAFWLQRQLQYIEQRQKVQ